MIFSVIACYKVCLVQIVIDRLEEGDFDMQHDWNVIIRGFVKILFID